MFARGSAGVFRHFFGYPLTAPLMPFARRSLPVTDVRFGITDQIFVDPKIASDTVEDRDRRDAFELQHVIYESLDALVHVYRWVGSRHTASGCILILKQKGATWQTQTGL